MPARQPGTTIRYEFSTFRNPQCVPSSTLPRKRPKLVLQIARSAGWGGQKAEPTTSKPTSRKEAARGATPYPPGIPCVSCRVQKTVPGRAGANASAARSLATHFNGPMLITLYLVIEYTHRQRPVKCYFPDALPERTHTINSPQELGSAAGFTCSASDDRVCSLRLRSVLATAWAARNLPKHLVHYF
jgi:hypothetical protein